MSVSNPPPTTDGPFGLQPNVAAGLGYLLGIIGGIIMFLGGGTNRFARWSAAQSIVLWGVYIVIWLVVDVVLFPLHLGLLALPVTAIVGILWFVLWIWTSITGFQGKEVQVPVIAGLTNSIFKNI
ncbi:MAG TPA: hypothetical protein VGK84_05520 [Candidatus Tumulicola sp.]|jgi:uncharacterized membrane protein